MKVLIVLDQFEQWLHARRGERNTELVEALRQCDGERVQCLLLVRDDFWLAVSRFMSELEIELVQSRNVALVDLFDPSHAKKVLLAYGRAFTALPERANALSKEQEAFLDQAILGLSQDDKIISVRLALFAEMVKGKPWTPATLKALGGLQGVGVRFLEETFTAATAPPQHRLHRRAAQAVLKALLPETGTDIRGSMRSHQDLLAASGYASRSRDLDALLRILDGELRLITPTEPEEVGEWVSDRVAAQPPALSLSHSPPRLLYYQLTHDYLVPSLREWLTRQQKATKKGRAGLRLAERAALWNAKPENRRLPAWWEWANIRLLSRPRDWTPAQKKMMRKATRHHMGRGLVLAVVLAFAGWGSYQGYGTLQAHALRDRLLVANTMDVRAIIEDMAPYRPWIDPLLRDDYRDAAANREPRKQLHASLALLPVDHGQVEYIYTRLLGAEPQEVAVIRDALSPPEPALVDRLWAVVEQPETGKEGQRLRAACALAAYDPGNWRWDNNSRMVVEQMVTENALHLGHWRDGFRPAKGRLLGPLAEVFRDRRAERTTERRLAADLLADYAADQPEVLADLLMDADDKQFATLFPMLTEHGERALVLLNAELERRLRPEWNDPEPAPSWREPDPMLVRKIEAAHGHWAKRFAFCQTLALADFLAVAEGLRASGYRPVRFRPYAADHTVRVAGVWSPDGNDWRMNHGLCAEEVRQQDEEHRRQGYQAVDVAAYRASDQEQYAALWVKTGSKGPAASLEVELDQGQFSSRNGSLRREGYRLTAYVVRAGADGRDRVSAVWLKESRQSSAEDVVFDGLEADYSGENYLGDLQVDVQVREAGLTSGTREGGVLEPGKVGCRYVAVWQPSASWASAEVHGQTPAEHVARCRDLLAQGYRPAAISVAAIPWPRAAGLSAARLRTEGLEPGTGREQWAAASVWHRPTLSEDANEKLARRQANAAVAFLKLGRAEMVWPLLKHSQDPRVRSYLIHLLAPLRADPSAVLRRLEEEQDISVRRALLLSLGEFREKELLAGEREALVPRMLAIYRDDPDPGIHGAAAWLLRQWGRGQKIEEIDQGCAKDPQHREGRIKQIRQVLAKDPASVKPQWYLNSQRQTFAVIPGPVEFLMGLPRAESGPDVRIHRRRIGRTFALATTAVTREQFHRFQPNFARHDMRCYPDPDCPLGGMTWYEAAEYCNWLSRQEGLPESEWCYEPNPEGQYANGMKLAVNYLRRTGYRLPTEAEWEYACRAGAVTQRFYGATEELLGKYAWYASNSRGQTWPVGSLKPNDWGLFDLYGNVIDWCQERYLPYVPGRGGRVAEDNEDTGSVTGIENRVVRGGAFNFAIVDSIRSAQRDGRVPWSWLSMLGFRPARTIIAE